MTKLDSARLIVPAGKVRCAGCGRLESRPHPARCACGLEGAWLWSSDRPPTDPEAPPLRTLAEIAPRDTTRRIATGEAELDRLLGGGWVRGESVLIHGPRGSGKTRCALRWATHSGRALAIEEEMPFAELRAIAESAGASPHALIPCRYTDDLPRLIRASRAPLIVLDSVSRLTDPAAAVRRLSELAHELGAICLLIAHENKRGSSSGPSSLEHDPDAVCRISSPRNGCARVSITKRRLGPCGSARSRILASAPPRRLHAVK